MGLFGKLFDHATGSSAAQLQSGSIEADIKATAKANEITDRRIGEAREYESEMANSAYQRSVVDMRAAGINPAVAMAGGGHGGARGGQSSAPPGIKEDPSSRMGARTGQKRARTDSARMMGDLALKGAGVASKWLQGKIQKEQVDKTRNESRLVREKFTTEKMHQSMLKWQSNSAMNHANSSMLDYENKLKRHPTRMGFAKYDEYSNRGLPLVRGAAGVASAVGIGRFLKGSTFGYRPRRGSVNSWGSNH